MNLTFEIEVENIKLEVTGEYTHLPNVLITENTRQDESEFEIKELVMLNHIVYRLDVFPLLRLMDDLIYDICFERARKMYLDKLSKND